MPDTRPPRLEVQDLTRAFGGRPVVQGVSFQVAAGQVMCLLGPSGCGKSTTLRMIAGVERPDAGVVRIDGQEVAGPGLTLPPERRGVGLMFQDFALFPHLTVAGNVAFGLSGDKAARARRVDELLERVNLTGFGPKHPHQLSGGEQQRVAVARALANAPSLLLADEPTAALDSVRGRQVLQLFRAIARTRQAAVTVRTSQPTRSAIVARVTATWRPVA